MPAVQVRGLAKFYKSGFRQPPIPALKKLDLDIAAGEIFGLLGPNGAGKTTLVKILLGVVMPSAGKADLFGMSVRKPEARQRVGFLPENHRFPGFLTPYQMLDLYGRMSGVPDQDRKRRIPELLSQVGMERWSATRMRKFSKGMMQRVGLAQALINDPQLVFLDEPTDGVDPIGRREIRDLLTWLRQQGVTVFLNSHLLSEVEQVCTRIAILNEGQLVREGTVADLTTAEYAYELVATPIPESVLTLCGEAIQPINGIAPERTEALVRYRVQVADRSGLNEILDQLRSAEVELEAVRPLRYSLEDSFVKLIQDRPGEEKTHL